MKDPSPDKSLAARDALFSLRRYATPEDQKQIDGALVAGDRDRPRTGHLRQGRHSIEKMLTAIGPDTGAMLARVLADPDASYPQAADLLGKVGDETARDKGARRARRARAEEKGRRRRSPTADVDVQGARRRGRPGGDQVPRGQGRSARTQDEAANAVRALGERRDPRCCRSR